MNFATEFYILTAFLSILGTALLVWHMNIAWLYITQTEQRMRYVTLLWFSMTIAYASATAVKLDQPIAIPSVLFSLGCIHLIVTMTISIKRTLANRSALEEMRVESNDWSDDDPRFRCDQACAGRKFSHDTDVLPVPSVVGVDEPK